MLIGLRSGHIPLNQYLFRIKKVDSPHCPHCPTVVETVHHFLLVCPHHLQARNGLIRRLGRRATSIPTLLSTPEAILPLAKYVDATGRLKMTFGEVSKCKK